MNLNNIMRDEFENYLKGYFPSLWNKKSIRLFLKKNKYEVDFKALSYNLNLPVRDFILRGGKRLRPTLLLTTLDALGQSHKKYLKFAALVELVHNGTLILDDIEDRGLLRRGLPTLHKKYGVDVAVNSGASLHVLPLSIILTNKDLTKEKKLNLVNIYTEELSNVCFGQALDIYWHNHPDYKVTVKKYLEMVRLKTGSLMRMSIRMACVIADKDKNTENAFKDFAESIGMAFQIIDDVLDLKATNGKFGKSYGNDISEGKISLPVVKALDTLPPLDRKRLVKILSMHTRNRKTINEAINLIKSTGRIDETIAFAKKLVRESYKKLEEDHNNKYDLSNLREIAEFFVNRDY